MRKAFTAAVLAALLVLTACGGDEKSRAPKRLPDVTLPGLDGAPAIDLGELRGPAVVNLWASYCDPCKDEMPLYAAYDRKYGDTTKVIGIDYQETRVGKAVQLATTSGVDYPLVTDRDGKLRAIGLPRLIVLDPDGTIAYDQYIEITSLAQLETIVSDALDAP